MQPLVSDFAVRNFFPLSTFGNCLFISFQGNFQNVMELKNEWPLGLFVFLWRQVLFVSICTFKSHFFDLGSSAHFFPIPQLLLWWWQAMTAGIVIGRDKKVKRELVWGAMKLIGNNCSPFEAWLSPFLQDSETCQINPSLAVTTMVTRFARDWTLLISPSLGPRRRAQGWQHKWNKKSFCYSSAQFQFMRKVKVQVQVKVQ